MAQAAIPWWAKRQIGRSLNATVLIRNWSHRVSKLLWTAGSAWLAMWAMPRRSAPVTEQWVPWPWLPSKQNQKELKRTSNLKQISLGCCALRPSHGMSRPYHLWSRRLAGHWHAQGLRGGWAEVRALHHRWPCGWGWRVACREGLEMESAGIDMRSFGPTIVELLSAIPSSLCHLAHGSLDYLADVARPCPAMVIRTT